MVWGEELVWTSEHMCHRYENWVGGLNGDWLVFRQRFFGVFFLIWYVLDVDDKPNYNHPIVANETSLPIDPMADTAPNYAEKQRNHPDRFITNPNIINT